MNAVTVNAVPKTPPGVLRIAAQEWYILRRNPAVWAALLLFALLLGVGLYNGAANARRLAAGNQLATIYNADQVTATRASLSRVQERKGKATGSAAIPWHAGIVAYELFPQVALPPAPLAAVAIGQSDLHPVTVLARTRFDETKAAEEIENPLYLLTGPFDLAFVLVYALPLLVLTLSYDVLSGERESGTLALALSQGATLRNLAMGKLLLRAVLIIGVSLVIPVSGLLLFGGDVTASAMTRLCLLLLAVMAYAFFWFGAALLVNSRGRSSAGNAVTLLGLWLALVVVVPSLAGALVLARHPTPSRLELVQAVRTVSDKAEAEGTALLEKQYRDHPAEAPRPLVVDPDDYWTRRYAIDADIERQTGPLMARFASARQSQRAAAARAEMLSPALLLQRVLSDIAGTGEIRQDRFENQLTDFRQAWSDYFLPRIWRRNGVPAEEWNRLPRFAFSEEAPGALARRLLPTILAPAVIGLLLGITALQSLRRSSPEAN